MNEEGGLYMGDNSIPDYNYEDTIDLQYKGLFMEQGKVLTSYATSIFLETDSKDRFLNL